MLKRKGVELHINIPVSEINYKYVRNAIGNALSLGADSISIIPAMPAGNAANTGTYVRRASFLQALEEAERVARELGITISVWCSPFLASLRWIKNLSFSNCRFWQVMDITPDGKAVFCDVLGLEVADVVRDGLYMAWKRLQSHRLNKLIMGIPPECKTCSSKNECMGGCYSRVYWYWKRLPAPDPLCPLVRADLKH